MWIGKFWGQSQELYITIYLMKQNMQQKEKRRIPK